MKRALLSLCIVLSLGLAAPAAWAQSEGVRLYKEGKYAEAARVLADEVAGEGGDVSSLTMLGIARVRAGDANGGVEPLKKALSLDDKYAEAHYGMGLAYSRLDRKDEAISELQTTVNLTPDHAYAHYALGMLYNQVGKRDAAIPHLRRFVELAPDAPEAPAVRSFLSKI
jgi:tetratricopeptide (TPR) repeat protein